MEDTIIKYLIVYVQDTFKNYLYTVNAFQDTFYGSIPFLYLNNKRNS